MATFKNEDQPTKGESIVEALDDWLTAKQALSTFGMDADTRASLEAEVTGKSVRLTLLLDLALGGV